MRRSHRRPTTSTPSGGNCPGKRTTDSHPETRASSSSTTLPRQRSGHGSAGHRGGAAGQRRTRLRARLRRLRGDQSRRPRRSERRLAGGHGRQVCRGTQAAEAKEYAKKVRSRVLAKHPEATFDTVGHSLGGHVATLVASDLHWSSTTFNSPDPWDAMSPEQREWLTKEIAAGRNPFRNFVNEWDPIGNSRGNTSGTAIFVHGLPGQDPLQYHNLDTGFHFTDGRITDITKTGRSRLEITENLLQGCHRRTARPSRRASPEP
ncbi:lipase family protein [Leifsonia sp. L25]|uniref:lipase family protein n=1 Tax=Leifsonia sp. L25 TaxID=3423957 RepID=UPI003D6861CF